MLRSHCTGEGRGKLSQDKQCHQSTSVQSWNYMLSYTDVFVKHLITCLGGVSSSEPPRRERSCSYPYFLKEPPEGEGVQQWTSGELLPGCRERCSGPLAAAWCCVFSVPPVASFEKLGQLLPTPPPQGIHPHCVLSSKEPKIQALPQIDFLHQLIWKLK